MFVEHEFYVGLREIDNSRRLSNTGFLTFLENIACIHSEMVGYGVNTIEQTQKTWILLGWRIKIFERPKFNENVKVKTWSRLIEKFYAYRDFEVYDSNGKLVAIASSKWIFVDTVKGKITRISEEVASVYLQENKSVFEEEFSKDEYPNAFSKQIDYKITRNMIDINNHLHNIYYLDIAEELINDLDVNEFEITYKHEIKLGDTVKALYGIKDETPYIVIKNEDESTVHAIIKLNI